MSTGAHGAGDAPLPLVFEGVVQCLAQPRAGDWRLRGRVRRANAGTAFADVELLLSGAPAPAQLPTRLHELHVQMSATALTGPQHASVLELHAREGRFALPVQALHLHRNASAAFRSVLPGAVLPLRTRAGWAVLLTLLRVPFVARLLHRSR